MGNMADNAPNFDARNTGLGGEAYEMGLSLAEAIQGIKEERAKREAFTQQYVEKASQQFPDYNVVISHNPGHVSGDEVIHQHYELYGVGWESIGYEIYFSPKGKPFKFEKPGDGGFINWAYLGEFTRNDNGHGNTIEAVVH